MQSAWTDRDAEAAIARYEKLGRDLALRVYTTRLLGQDPRLVLHGGGNTSVKTRLADLNGEDVDVLCVKGSGWDMGTIEPTGLPAVRLAPLLKLRARETLSDEEMVRLQRANLIDPAAPNPSVEALLHAFIPHKFVDHTHSTAVLALTDQPDGEALCREVFGPRAPPDRRSGRPQCGKIQGSRYVPPVGSRSGGYPPPPDPAIPTPAGRGRRRFVPNCRAGPQWRPSFVRVARNARRTTRGLDRGAIRFGCSRIESPVRRDRTTGAWP